jgi:GNAT superfamily N-acetyltransferase
MSRPVGLRGPEPAGAEQIDRINRLFSEAFTDRYQRDGMSGVRVPFLNPAIWRFAIADAADGAMVWHDVSGGIIAFNMVHRSGTEGWMGPLAVRPDRQGEGIGGLIVRAGIKWLEHHGARTIGLETMPRTIENIGFYSGLGFRPGHLTVSMTRELDGPGRGSGARLSALGREDELRRCRALVDSLAPGVDFSREISLTLEHGLGDVTLLSERGALAGFALWHAAPLAEGRSGEEVRVLKLAARDPASFRRVVEAVETDAWTARAHRVSIRCQTAYREAYGMLLDAGYRVHWTDLRMTVDGKGEAPVADGGVVFSNWEI